MEEWFVVDEWGRDREFCHDNTEDCACFEYDGCENCPYYFDKKVDNIEKE